MPQYVILAMVGVVLYCWGVSRSKQYARNDLRRFLYTVPGMCVAAMGGVLVLWTIHWIVGIAVVSLLVLGIYWLVTEF